MLKPLLAATHIRIFEIALLERSELDARAGDAGETPAT